MYGGRFARAAAAYTFNTTDVFVTGAGTNPAYIFTVGDVIRNARTGENMAVTAIAPGGDTTKLTVTRQVGTVAMAAGNAGDGLYIVGNASEEGAGARSVNTTQITPVTNYTQIFRTTIAVTRTEREANLYGGKDLPYLRAKKGTEHALDIERAFWFGQKGATTGVQGHPKRYTGGIDEFITAGNSYVQNQNGPLSAGDLNTFLREAFTYGNDTKVMFCGGVVMQAINEIARGQILMRPVESTYGMKISQWVTPFGVVNMVHDPLFVEDYAGSAYLLDMESFAYRYFNNSDTQLRTNIQAPDADGQVDEYITEAGLQRAQAPKHAMLKGVTQ